eukprot:TRINITY_DN12441_c0_g1_i1.p1 TRINITY_DN12441_c0_g1~~TRINITY_DN12441_c0_g1_i1.p1  ORF type:complete len:338 (-),score=-10.10 TRINITY_DN12441_c0_g1_i1:231-1244(-)
MSDFLDSADSIIAPWEDDIATPAHLAYPVTKPLNQKKVFVASIRSEVKTNRKQIEWRANKQRVIDRTSPHREKVEISVNNSLIRNGSKHNQNVNLHLRSSLHEESLIIKKKENVELLPLQMPERKRLLNWKEKMRPFLVKKLNLDSMIIKHLGDDPLKSIEPYNPSEKIAVRKNLGVQSPVMRSIQHSLKRSPIDAYQLDKRSLSMHYVTPIGSSSLFSLTNDVRETEESSSAIFRLPSPTELVSQVPYVELRRKVKRFCSHISEELKDSEGGLYAPYEFQDKHLAIERPYFQDVINPKHHRSVSLKNLPLLHSQHNQQLPFCATFSFLLISCILTV